MNFDFNNASEQNDSYALIPDGTHVSLSMNIRATSDDGLVKAKTTESMMLDCELTIDNGKYAGRKLWKNMVMVGSEKACNISRSTLRAILESSRGIMPQDSGQGATEARVVKSLWDFDGMSFVAKVGVETAKPGSGFKDKNIITSIVTPDMPEYKQVKLGGEVVVPVKKNKATTDTVPWSTDTATKTVAETPDTQDNVPDWAK